MFENLKRKLVKKKKKIDRLALTELSISEEEFCDILQDQEK